MNSWVCVCGLVRCLREGCVCVCGGGGVGVCERRLRGCVGEWH